MTKLKKYMPQSEAELHMIIKSDLDALEEGLEVLKHEYPSGKGIVDFLCIDSGGRLVIIEVKLNEDENILFQSLRYFSDIDKDRYLITNFFSKKKINPEESPRIILIAKRFSEDIRRLSTLVVPEVELFEYTSVNLPNNEKGIIYHSVSLPVGSKSPAKPTTIEELINYVTEDSIKPIIEKLRNTIKNLGENIEEYATQNYIGYKHTRGRQFAYISILRKEVEFGALIVDEGKRLLDYEGIHIKTGKEDISDILEKIKTSFINLGGSIKSE